ncbi:hypothetical protein Y032_1044g3483 [Ancylostoma ceylanicum]|uniref:Uncharacterized protein n=1 Tax=Ancylostoma ceylanicum TaxID=53326 RepID=A0A016W7B5_9BILA|nr:hypothetical protein Y032_1044g3483 [Ancylostoma ceylanicum]
MDEDSRTTIGMKEESMEVNGEKIERVVEFVYIEHSMSSPRNPMKALQEGFKLREKPTSSTVCFYDRQALKFDSKEN